jgi:hypothetical protein
MVGTLAYMLSGCDPQPPTSRQVNMAQQESIMTRATNAVPVPVSTNFLAREAVAKQVRRLDEKGKLFYVYVTTPMGQIMGYYVSNTRPVSTCSLLTPPEEIVRYGESQVVMKTPGLGGTYSPNPSCGGVFFFDAETDAYIEISGLSYFVSDQPLSLKAEPIKVQQNTDNK